MVDSNRCQSSLFTLCFELKLTLTNLLLSEGNSSTCVTYDERSSKTTVFPLSTF